ncbi:MAG TPA: hypothetical protein VGQ76_27985 [Thermoanaerobaculia bacterium]|jgi:hypothetical protein|nr:hypothetical protein [Thermoanaerobaculia bacterium]
MEHLPSEEERQWLARALQQLIAKRGVAILDAAPLVEPTNEWFPEPWDTTAAHAHRLAQRLLHYAGLTTLRPTLSAFEPQLNEDGTAPRDAHTAGWFAGIENRRAYFGLHVGQFSDPEAAAGVLAHEVAHAWRTYHQLIVDDREEEELLTDVTTILLGFGILSTNNTDRYRSSGTWDTTSWSVSAVGYLPPQAMSYLLALWSAARGRSGERKTIERHLEPNQLAFFRAALDEIKSPRQLLGIFAPAETYPSLNPRDFTSDTPFDDELEEPEYEEATRVNRGVLVYRRAKGDADVHVITGIVTGFAFGATIGALAYGFDTLHWAIVAGGCAAVAGGFMMFRSRRDVCSGCGTLAEENVAICGGCGGTLGRRVTLRELQRLREEELERNAERDVEFVDCEFCQPEDPCPRHI